MARNLAIEHELFDWCRHPIQYRERSDRMPALNHRFKRSWDYRVPASGRFARGTVSSCDHVGVLPHSNDSSHGSVATGSIWDGTQRSFYQPAPGIQVGDTRQVILSRESCARLTRSLPLRGSDIECCGPCECFIDRDQTDHGMHDSAMLHEA